MKWRRQIKSPALRKENKIPSPRLILFKKIFKIAFFSILIGLIIYGVWFVTRISSLNINEIQVEGGETIDKKKIQNIADTELKGDFYHFIPKTFILTFPEEKIISDIINVPRVESVKLTRDGRTLKIFFTEHTPFALWCERLKDSPCFFINSLGYAFAPAPKLDGGAYLRIVEEGRIPAVRESVLSEDSIKGSMAFAKAASDSLGLNLISLKYDGENVTYYIAGGGELRTSSRISIEETLQNLKTILSSKEFSHLEPGNFDYIDLRYSDKVFVNEGVEEFATSTEESLDVQ